MIRSTVKVFNHLPQVTRAIEEAAAAGVDAATREAATVAQAGASIRLELRQVPARSTGNGYSGGIVSRRESDVDGKTTPIAAFFDKGTLGKRKGKLSAKSSRRSSWTVRRGGGSHVAQRGEITPEKGIKAERFFLKARLAGRKALLGRILRELR